MGAGFDSKCRACRAGVRPGFAWLEESLYDSTQICRPIRAAPHGTRRAPRWTGPMVSTDVQAVAGIDPHTHSGTVAVRGHTGALLACASFLGHGLRASRVCLGVRTRTGARIQRIGSEGSGSLKAAGDRGARGRLSTTYGKSRPTARTSVVVVATAHRPISPTPKRSQRKRFTDQGLPPAGKHTDASAGFTPRLLRLRSWRKSLILQRVRHLTELKPILNLLGRQRSCRQAARHQSRDDLTSTPCTRSTPPAWPPTQRTTSNSKRLVET